MTQTQFTYPFKFIPEYAFEKIQTHWISWASTNKFDNINWVVGISGGKDSTVVAALAAKTFGKDKVIGVTLPCDEQSDYSDSLKVIEHLGIKHININVGDAVSSILQGIENNALEASYDTKTNLPARIRMSALYAVAQTMNGFVLNTSNLTENRLGYSTLFGDHAGGYAPLCGLTVSEVIELGDWLGIPYELTHKTPIDGLQPKTDEEKLGMKYADVDRLIRTNEGTYANWSRTFNKNVANRFKLKLVNIPGPQFLEFPDFFRN